MQSFLEQVKSIRLEEQEERKKALAQGKEFNVFKVLKLSRSEVRLHSALIAEFLNPKGKHGMGDKPLEAFLEQVSCREGFHFDTHHARVRVEEHIGTIDVDYENGGYLDIIVQSGEMVVIIENKIYAKDQKKQLIRYHHFAKQYKQGFLLLYLTLTGEMATDYSTKSDKEILRPGQDYYTISYKRDIVEWIKKCIQFAADKPLVRETLQQYLNLINEMTNNMGDKNSAQLIETMIEHHEDVASIWSERNNYALAVFKRHLEPTMKSLAEELGLAMSFENGFFDGKTKKKLYLSREKWDDLHIIIESTTASNYWLHVNGQDQKHPKLPQPLKSLGENTSNEYPFGWSWLREGYWDLYSPVSVSAIISGAFSAVMKVHLEQIIQEIEENLLSH